MAEELLLTNPEEVGDIGSKTMIDRFQVAAFSMNRQKEKRTTGKEILSVMVEDPVTGWTYTIVYEGADARAELKAINIGNFSSVTLHTRILQKLLADGKLPAGVVGGTPDP
ncbi:hypothetical protein LCGC14_1083620 [marine sediment metagenome]|uniref:Uncharacterized protein n=1 Tax=marine sediment metagenome TaxID=412755 RepID=A0A0F9QKH9_9ZZZZ